MKSGRRLNAGAFVIWRMAGKFLSRYPSMSIRSAAVDFYPRCSCIKNANAEPAQSSRRRARVISSFFISPFSSFVALETLYAGHERSVQPEKARAASSARSRRNLGTVRQLSIQMVSSHPQSNISRCWVSSLVLRPFLDFTNSSFRPQKFRRASTNKPTPQQSAPSGCTASLRVNYRSMLMGRGPPCH